ncbi:MAG: hypothetical protein ACJ77E_03110 [Gaiellaceae bacterium]
MSEAGPRRSILLLTDNIRGQANTLQDHVKSFGRYSRHRVYRYATRGVTNGAGLDLDRFDVVVLHYSVAATFDTYLAPPLRERLRAFAGLKIQFLQDEFRWVDAVTSMTRSLGIDVLFTVAPPLAAEQLYGSRLPGVHLEYTIPGFVPEELERRKSPPLAKRPIEVGYRGRSIPFYLGALSQEKVEIARRFRERARAYDLVCDIAWGENDRIYGERWNRFIASCRATLGTESGASIADFDGSLERRTRDYLIEHPGASFDEVHEQVLAEHEGNVVVNTISPRILEAAALRSGLVLFPGEYSGAVSPWEAYVPLEKDFSNMDEVVEAVRDLPTLTQMTERAHEALVASGRYSHRAFVRRFDEVVDARAPAGALRARVTHLRASVERARETREVAGRRLQRPATLLAPWSALSLLLQSDAAVRALVDPYVREASLRRAVPVQKLVDDALRLGILHQAQSGAHPIEQFWLEPHLGSERTLTLVSVSGDREAADKPRAYDAARAALRAGHVDSVVWDHAPIALVTSILRRDGIPLTLAVGYHARDGVYAFTALSELARRRPAHALAALGPVLLPPAPYAPPPPRQASPLRRAAARVWSGRT